jgi:hypothetical protein
MTDMLEDGLPLFRSGGPQTSRDAAVAAAKFRGEHCRSIVQALAEGPAGKTEIAARAGMTEQQVARRMHELRRCGLVELTGQVAKSAAGRQERQWMLCGRAR